jgi:hypothetical protein
MKRILVFSPVRSGLSTDYCRSLIALLNSSLAKGPNAKYAIDFAWTSGTSVAMARDEGTDLFLRRGDDELISWDVDLGHKDPATMVSMFARLLSHDVDIVAAPYVGHNFNSQWHGAASGVTAKVRPDGLIHMQQIPLGFSKKKRCVFEKIKADNPHLQYVFKDTHMDKAKTGMFEFYPNGIYGPTTGQSKIERIKEILKEKPTVASFEIMEEISRIVYDPDHSKNILLGEDYYFCELAKKSGFDLFIDNNLIVPHRSDVLLPVNNQKILQELGQNWRLKGDADPTKASYHLSRLETLLTADIP